MTLITVDDQAQTWLIYIILAGVGLLISYFLLRWMFGIDKRIKQNDEIIRLLTNIALKLDVPETKIVSID